MEQEALKILIKNYPIITSLLIVLIPILYGIYLTKFILVNRQMRIVEVFVDTLINRMALSYADCLLKYVEETKKNTSSQISDALKVHDLLLESLKLYTLKSLRTIVENNHIPKTSTKDFDEFCLSRFNLIYQGMQAIYSKGYIPNINLIPFRDREIVWLSYKDEYFNESKELLISLAKVKYQKGGLNVFKRFFTNQ